MTIDSNIPDGFECVILAQRRPGLTGLRRDIRISIVGKGKIETCACNLRFSPRLVQRLALRVGVRGMLYWNRVERKLLVAFGEKGNRVSVKPGGSASSLLSFNATLVAPDLVAIVQGLPGRLFETDEWQKTSANELIIDFIIPTAVPTTPVASPTRDEAAAEPKPVEELAASPAG